MELYLHSHLCKGTIHSSFPWRVPGLWVIKLCPECSKKSDSGHQVSHGFASHENIVFLTKTESEGIRRRGSCVGKWLQSLGLDCEGQGMDMYRQIVKWIEYLNLSSILLIKILFLAITCHNFLSALYLCSNIDKLLCFLISWQVRKYLSSNRLVP
jgi:hypothetical protein